MQNDLAPIVLFVYNRPWHTEQTLNALMQNELADQSELHIYSDGPKQDANEEQLKQIKEVRRLIRAKNWCKKIHIVESVGNKGLADSIINGVSQVLNKSESVIVLEDDIITSKGFLKYMNDALKLYEKKDEIMEVSAFMFPINVENLPDTFLYKANSCWGWGTWKRAWTKYNNDALDLYLRLIEKKIDWASFNAFQGNAFKEQLIDNIENVINTWAIKWHATIYLFDGNVLHPKVSLVKNIGFDGTGVHCGLNDLYDKAVTAESVTVEWHERLHDRQSLEAIQKYFQPELYQRAYTVAHGSMVKRILLKIASKLR
jgi:hypothetical protein